MRTVITLVSAALFAASVAGSAFAAPASAVHKIGVVKVEKKPRPKNCRGCKTN